MATKRQNDRLLRVARALREHPAPKRFTMSCYIHGDEFDHRKTKNDWCGTPACAFGTFASRPDLQRFVRVSYDIANEPSIRSIKGNTPIHFDNWDVLVYFGITFNQAYELFNITGCGGAKTPIQAAKYIEKFVQKRS